jgi:hypothetical protein
LEIAQLKREVARLKAERDILKKAAAYFAKESCAREVTASLATRLVIFAARAGRNQIGSAPTSRADSNAESLLWNGSANARLQRCLESQSCNTSDPVTSCSAT